MGVKDLWKILSPTGKKVTLFELSNKKIAIDLSCWICESQVVGEKYVPMQPGMHLRYVKFIFEMKNIFMSEHFVSGMYFLELRCS